MYTGHLPLLTKGPFALVFGGSSILPQLSQQAPGRGVPVLIATSAVLQGCVFCVKKIRSRNQTQDYLKNLWSTLVENVTNVHSIVVLFAASVASCGFGLHHMLTVAGHQDTLPEDLSPLLPANFAWLLALMGFASTLPYLTSRALR